MRLFHGVQAIFRHHAGDIVVLLHRPLLDENRMQLESNSLHLRLATPATLADTSPP